MPGALSSASASAAGTGTLHHTVPVVVIERERVVLANRRAMGMGVRAGMRRAGVQALSAEVVQFERAPDEECRLMTAAALALLHFTPHVVIDPSPDAATLMLDVTASLRLFGGHRALCRAVRACVRQLGAMPQVGCGTTAYGAAWLASMPLRIGRRGAVVRPARRAVQPARMARLLDALPVDMLHGLADPGWLGGIGCRTVGEVRRLPRAGLKRRLGTTLTQRLDQAYDDVPVRFPWFVAPPAFLQRMELHGRIESAAGVLAGAHRLLLALAGWLAVRQAGVIRFVLRMEHERYRLGVDTVATPVTVALAQPSRDPVHLSKLLQERLDRLQFGAPVVGLALAVEAMDEWLPRSDTLFPEPGGGPAELGRVLDTLAARLGRENVLQPQPRADHRPECANHWQAVEATGVGGGPTFRAAAPIATAVLPERPLWLLEQPLALPVKRHRPCHGGPLILLSRPERVEAGWWDGGLVTRDYFIAERADGLRCWVYRERPSQQDRQGSGDDRWFLHGLFA
jgi:protein ImuB